MEKEKNIVFKITEIIVGITFVFLLPIFFAIVIYGLLSSYENQKEQIFDIPADTYICTDPDTDQEYIVVITENGVSICNREDKEE